MWSPSMLVAQGSLMRSHVSVSVTNKPECLKVSAHYMMLIHTLNRASGVETLRPKKKKNVWSSLMCFFFLKYNSIFHFTLASTTGGKDLGLVVGIYKTRRPKMSFFSFLISRWFGLLSFSLFFFLLHTVWHTRFHLQSAMEAEGTDSFTLD